MALIWQGCRRDEHQSRCFVLPHGYPIISSNDYLAIVDIYSIAILDR